MNWLRYIGPRLVCGVLLTGVAANAAALEYVFSFAGGDSHFAPERGENASTLDRMLALLRDYHGVPGLRFALVGEVPAACNETADCKARDLVRERVEAITGEAQTRADTAMLFPDLQWRTIASTAVPVDTLQLKLLMMETAGFSAHCPYQVKVQDSRLPAPLTTDDAADGWVAIHDAHDIPLSSTTLVRVLSLNSAQPGAFVARQVIGDDLVALGEKTTLLELNAAQLRWSGNYAELELDPAMHSRAIGDFVHPWNDPATPSAAEASTPGTCRIRFVNTVAVTRP